MKYEGVPGALTRPSPANSPKFYILHPSHILTSALLRGLETIVGKKHRFSKLRNIVFVGFLYAKRRRKWESESNVLGSAFFFNLKIESAT